ncbi:Counting factor associated D [Micractinium conductrix]|uniref:Counting factor associated D n=1 Tax=Micractinium conductrix TaxID=554055 RepID=A0A2P6V6Q2_9CHLO|nr:Counting factor associated D [Micractinium conductrix]|eukprot:PSC69765.1 Counting factor associated D [Micractinium conductrix]
MLRPLLLLAALASAAATTIEPDRPVWPQEYQVSFDFEVPYIGEYQKSGFKYKYQAWHDSRLGRQKMVRDDVETVLVLVPVNKMYEVFPAYDHLICWEDEIHGGTGPTLEGAEPGSGDAEQWSEETMAEGRPLSQQRRLRSREGAAAAEGAAAEAQRGPYRLFDWEKKQPGKLLPFVLPDISGELERWVYAGTEVFKETGDSAHVYEWDLTEGGLSQMTYKFYVTREGAPLRLWMLGTNLYSGGHKDEYIATYYDWQPGPVPDEAFHLPDGIAPDDCKPAAPDAALAASAAAAAAAAGKAPAQSGWTPGALLHSFAQHMPSVHWGHKAYDAFIHRSGRRHSHESEYHARRAEFERSAAFVAGWTARRAAHLAGAANAAANASADSSAAAPAAPAPHEVALNHFADWTREEWLALVRPERFAKRLLAREQPGTRLHRVSTPSHMVPAEVVWRGTPADSPVKDQAACGSCWVSTTSSFSSVGAIESAWYRATGKQLLFSEQHMIDCGWEAGNSGCYGGDQIKILNWVFRRGALAAQADYPYQGINNFCRTDVPQKHFKGHWVLVEGGEEALKEALLTRGPMVVSIDASADSFRFYSGGLYHNPDCATNPADLDHAVILSGYATTDDGVEYWLVKNIWSPFWGEKGYLRVTRKGNDCGVSSEPVYVDLAPVGKQEA